MDYKLAKQLKDAGFPQKTELYWVRSFNGYEKWTWQMVKSDGLKKRTTYAIPTLEELIDACGVHFRELRHNVTSRNWDAIYDKRSPARKRKIIRNGKTPLEAMAKLFIELNKKGKYKFEPGFKVLKRNGHTIKKVKLKEISLIKNEKDN